MFEPITFNSRRYDFFKDLNRNNIREVLDKYFPVRLKNRLEKYGRLFSIKIGCYSAIVKIGKIFRKRN